MQRKSRKILNVLLGIFFLVALKFYIDTGVKTSEADCVAYPDPKACQICITMGDRCDVSAKTCNAGEIGTEVCTPFDGSSSGWIMDSNGFDPDAMKVSVFCP